MDCFLSSFDLHLKLINRRTVDTDAMVQARGGKTDVPQIALEPHIRYQPIRANQIDVSLVQFLTATEGIYPSDEVFTDPCSICFVS